MKRSLLQCRLSVFALVLTMLAAPVCGAVVASAAAPQKRGAAMRQAKPAPTPPAGAKPLAAPAPLVNKVLANGLEVIVLEDHSVPLVTVEMAVRNGSFTEPPELNGLSHLYEHMFFKPSHEIVMRESYLKTIDQLGHRLQRRDARGDR